MFNSFKALIQKASHKRKSQLKRNEKGDLLFEMQLSHEQLYSPFSVRGSRFLNPELEQVFDSVMEEATPNDKIEILIHTENPTEERRQKFENILDSFYLTKLEISNRNFWVSVKQGLFLLLIGFAIFALYTFLGTVAQSQWLEMLDIASWVFVWEAVDVIFLGLINHIHIRKKFKQMVNAKITFTNPVPPKPTNKQANKNVSKTKEIPAPKKARKS